MEVLSMKFKKLVGLLLVLIIAAFSATFAFAQTTVESGVFSNGVTWTLDDSGTLRVSGTGEVEGLIDLNGNIYETRGFPDSIKKSVKTVIVEEGITSIGRFAFYDFTRVEKVTLPNTVSFIGVDAFDGCALLKEINFPNSLKCIEPFAFQYCTSLKKIVLPESLETLGGDMSYSNNGESYIRYENDPAFPDCPFLTDVTVLNPQLKIENNEFGYSVIKPKLGYDEFGPAYAAWYEEGGDMNKVSEILDFNQGSQGLEYAPHDVTIKGYSGSTAEEYALNNAFTFENLGEQPYFSGVQVGDNAWASLSRDGLLRIYGTGSLWSEDEMDTERMITCLYCIYAYCPNIKNVVIDEGITSLGYISAYGLVPFAYNLESISYPATFSSDNVGLGAVDGYNPKLNKVYVNSKDITEIPAYLSDALRKGFKKINCSEYLIEEYLDANAEIYKLYIDTYDKYGIEFFGENRSEEAEAYFNERMTARQEKIEDIQNRMGEDPFVYPETEAEAIRQPMTVYGYENTKKLIEDYNSYIANDLGADAKIDFVNLCAHKNIDLRSSSSSYEPGYLLDIYCLDCGFVINENVSFVFDSLYDVPAILRTFTMVATYELSLEKDGQKIQPNGNITVKLPLPDGYNADTTAVYYIPDDGSYAERLETKCENGYVVFETNHFSKYAIVDESSKTDKPEPEPEPEQCDCICHKSGKFYRIINKIFCIFWRLFGINKVCSCGVNHY